MHRERRALPALVAAALALGAALAGCTADPSPDPAPAPTATLPAPSATPSAPPSPSPRPVADDPLVVRAASGPVEVVVTVRGVTIRDPHMTVTPGDETTITIDLAGLPTRALPEVALASPGTFVLNPDGSVTVLDDDGAAVGGLTRPTPGALFSAVDGRRLELTRPDEPVDAAEVTTRLGTRALASADWGEREGGRSLAVDPTAWTRDAGQAGWAAAWAELAAAEPDAASPGMYDQLVCHAIGAPDKETWNLEPWRPDVGLVAVMAARCNPVE